MNEFSKIYKAITLKEAVFMNGSLSIVQELCSVKN